MRSTIKGLPISFNSLTAVSSAFMYESRFSSPKEPSVVTTTPMVECSLMTFLVPISAALVKGISVWNQGVLTMRSCWFSIWPLAPSTINPTQSMSRIWASIPSARRTWAASLGINFGSVVMMVFPAALWGSSSTVRALAGSSVISGSTSCSTNRLINVDFPVRTGPTTPR